MTWKPYPVYKPSGIEWLGDVPEHWTVKRGRFLMRVNPPCPRFKTLDPTDEVSFVPMEAVGIMGGLYLEQSREIADISSGYTQFEDGDVVVAKITPCFENGKGAFASGLRNGAACGTTELHVLRATETLDRRFLFFLSISELFRKCGEAEMYGAGGQKRVPPEFAKDFRTPLPPPAEQRAIADFLDRETGKIDRLVAKKRELIGKLKEERSALITEVVTGKHPVPIGTNDPVGTALRAVRECDKENGRPVGTAVPAVRQNPVGTAVPAVCDRDDANGRLGEASLPKMKPSSIEWLGDVPEHWEVKRLRHLALLKSGESITSSEIDVEGEYPVYGGNGLRGYTTIYSHDGHYVLIGRQGALCGNVNYARGKFWASEHAVVVRPLVSFEPFWMGELLRAMNLNQYSVSAAQPGLSVDVISALKIPVPPLPEQRAIADFLDRETGKIDRLAEKVEEAIGRLQEYRAALITAAVTGKIDVSNALNTGVRAAVAAGEALEYPEPRSELMMAAEDDTAGKQY